MGGTAIFYETVKGLPFERLRTLVQELRNLKFIGTGSDEGLLEKLFAIIAHAGGGKPFVDALGALDTRNYFGANMALLHRAQLRDDAVVVQWQRLTSKIEHDGGVYRFLETHEKWKNAAKLCRYASNDLWLQRAINTDNEEKGKKAKKKGMKNFDKPPISNMAMKLSHSVPPGALVGILPPIDPNAAGGLAKTLPPFGDTDASSPGGGREAPAYTPYAWEDPQATPTRASGRASEPPTI